MKNARVHGTIFLLGLEKLERVLAIQNSVDLAEHVEVDFLAHDRVLLVHRVVQNELPQEFGVCHQLTGRLLTQELEVPEQGAAGVRF